MIWAWIKSAFTTTHDSSRRAFLRAGCAVLAAPVAIKVASLLPAPVETWRAASSASLYNELTAVTRKAFVPRMFVQIYHSSPVLAHMMQNAEKKNPAAQSQIRFNPTVPVRQSWDHRGNFNIPRRTR